MDLSKLLILDNGKTVAVSENNKKRFGFDPDQKNDFLFIWGHFVRL